MNVLYNATGVWVHKEAIERFFRNQNIEVYQNMKQTLYNKILLFKQKFKLPGFSSYVFMFGLLLIYPSTIPFKFVDCDRV